MQGRLFYHLYLRGNFQQDIFFDDEDFIQAINRLALSAKATQTTIWAFEYLDNHYHLVVETQDKTSFMHHYRMSTSYCHRKKYSVGGMLGSREYGSGLIIDPIDDNGEDLKDAISYVLRNVKRHHIVDDFYSYKWSTVRQYFSSADTYKPIDLRSMKQFLPYPHKLPDGYRMDKSGIILLQDFVNLKGVEQLFGSKRKFYDFLSAPSRRESEAVSKENTTKENRIAKEKRIAEENRLASEKKKNYMAVNNHFAKLQDNEISQFIIAEIDRMATISRMAPKTIRQMTRTEKMEMALLVSQHFKNSTTRQLSRILGIPFSSLRRELTQLAHHVDPNQKLDP